MAEIRSTGGLDIRQTVDGVSIDSGAEKQSAKDNGKTPIKKRMGRPDPYIWGIYLSLLIISVIELFSASSTEVSGDNVYIPLIRHVIFLVIGLGIVLWLQRTPYTIISKFAWIFAVISLILLLVSSVMGEEINGAQRAIRIAGMTIQPAEIAKLAVVCLLASILGKNQTPGGVTNRGVITSACVVLAFGVCMFKDGMTNMLLMFIVSLSMMMIGGIQFRKILLVIAVYIVGGGAIYAMKSITPSTAEFDKVKQEQALATASPATKAEMQMAATDQNGRAIDSRRVTRIKRITRFMNGVKPDDPIDDMNRQVVFSKFALAHGGVFGQGPGNSRESARLPLAFSDYIFSIIVEDMGMVGGIAVLVLFLLLIARAGRVAYKCSRAFPAFLIMGCAVMIVAQALVHMAIVTGLFPVSGQPLPFISKGGTSIIVMSTALGIMLSVCRFAAHSDDKKQIKEEIESLPEDMQAANYSNS
jgi:cell division protein FtsW